MHIFLTASTDFHFLITVFKLKRYSRYSFERLREFYLKFKKNFQLYASYGFAENIIALLFLAGFGSSSTFGTFTGPLADKFGRKKMTLVFCVM